VTADGGRLEDEIGPPMATAAVGMAAKRALSGVWAMVSPPAARTARRPRAPSEPVPESTTAAPWPFQCSATDSNRWSMLGLGPKRGSGATSLTRFPSTLMSWFGGQTLTVSGSKVAPSTASTTWSAVPRASSTTMRLPWSGERCWATT